MKTLKIIIPFCVLIASCSQGRMEESGIAGSADMVQQEALVTNVGEGSDNSRLHSPIAEPEQKTEATTAQPNLKIIRTGNLSVESKEIAASKKNLDQLIKQLGGYYEQESATAGEQYTSYDLTVRIPQSKFDALIDGIEDGSDKVTSKSIRADDVSLQYYDLESRLKSKQAYLDRYQKMVASAKSVKDLLEIEEQIRQLQEEIESTAATLRSLSGQVNYSTLQISLFEYKANLPQGSNSFWVKTKGAFTFGWNLIESITLGIIGSWPLILIAIVATIVWRRIKRRNKLRKDITNR